MINRKLSLLSLSLFLLNIPSILLFTNSLSISSPISYGSFFLLVILILLNSIKIDKDMQFLLTASLMYFIISLLNFEGSIILYIINFIKFFLLFFGLNIILKYVDNETILWILFLGAITIFFDSIYFRFNDVYEYKQINLYNRYSGFYLNPNTAAFITLCGYILAIQTTNKYKLILMILFTLFGMLTLSRTFFVSWIIVNILNFNIGIKNIVYGFLILFIVPFTLSYFELFNLDSDRLNLITNFISSGSVDYNVLYDDSRESTWSVYYDKIWGSLFIGNGYQTFNGINQYFKQGVHNTYLLILGESGIIPFLLFLVTYIKISLKAFNRKNNNYYLFLLSIALGIQLMVNHNFFDQLFMLFIFLLISNRLSYQIYNKEI